MPGQPSENQEIKITKPNQGDFIFSAGKGQEMIRLAANGDIFVKGRLAINDIEVVQNFKEWLAEVRRK